MLQTLKKKEEDARNVKFDDELTFDDNDDDFEEGPNVKVLEQFNVTQEIKSQAFEIILTEYIIDTPDYEKIAGKIKREMDKRFGGLWNCTMGIAFGFEVSFNDNCLIYLCIDEAIGVVLWQC